MNACRHARLALVWPLLVAAAYAQPEATTTLAVDRVAMREVTIRWPAARLAAGSDIPAPWVQIAYTTTGPITSENIESVYGEHLGPAFAVTGAVGSPQVFVLTGLEPGTMYWIAIRSYDDTGVSPASNNVTPTTLLFDLTPPPAITDLDIVETSIGPRSAAFTCTVPADLGGHVIRLELRQSPDGPIDSDAKFWQAQLAATRVVAWPGDIGTVVGLQTTTLEPGLAYHFCVRAMDDANLWGDVSNDQVRDVTPDTVAPAAPRLFLSARTGTTVTMSWTSVGNDGMIGTPSEYDLRYSTFPITEETFDDATPDLTVPAPGASTSHTVPGLLPTTLYYFAVKAGDLAGNRSPMSNVIQATTMDNVHPARISVRVASTEYNRVTYEWNAPGDDGNAGTATRYIAKWSSADPAAHPYWWTGVATPITLPAPAAGGTLEEFTLTHYQAEGNSIWFALLAVDEDGNEGRLSNIAVTRTVIDIYGPARVEDLEGVQRSLTPANGVPRYACALTWTNPGDPVDTLDWAAGFEIKTSIQDPSTFPSVGAWWDDPSTSHIDGGRPPDLTQGIVLKPAGLQGTALHEVPGHEIYFFALRSEDRRGNWGEISNIVRIVVDWDMNPPGRITDVAVGRVLSRSVTLTWTAPRDDSTSDGRVDGYTVRFSYRNPDGIDHALWVSTALAIDVANPVTGLPGTTVSMKLPWFEPEKTHFLVISAYDRFGNRGDTSNMVTFRTVQPDFVRPATIGDLTVSFRQSTYVILTWTAPGDDENAGTAERYELRWKADDLGGATDDEWWAGAAPITEFSPVSGGLPMPAVAGAAQSARIGALAPDTNYYFAIRAVDEEENWSPIPVRLLARTEPRDEVPPAAIATLRAEDEAGMDVALSWTAEGEDGAGSERAVEGYAIRYSTRAPESFDTIDGWWDHATPYGGEAVVPALPGALQGVKVTDLAPAHYWFAVRAVDEAPNWSAVSNVAWVIKNATGSEGNTNVCSAGPLRPVWGLWGGMLAMVAAILRKSKG